MQVRGAVCYIEESDSPPTVVFLSLLTRQVVPLISAASAPKPFILGLFRRRSPEACLSPVSLDPFASVALDLAAAGFTDLDKMRVLD